MIVFACVRVREVTALVLLCVHALIEVTTARAVMKRAWTRLKVPIRAPAADAIINRRTEASAWTTAHVFRRAYLCIRPPILAALLRAFIEAPSPGAGAVAAGAFGPIDAGAASFRGATDGLVCNGAAVEGISPI